MRAVTVRRSLTGSAKAPSAEGEGEEERSRPAGSGGTRPRAGDERWLGWALVALGCSIALCSLLGPLALGLIVYRTSVAAERQIVGADAAGLFVSAPVSIAIGVLLLRGRREVAVLGMAPAVFAAYTYMQLAVGNEFLHRPGNVEKFFPLLVAVFVLAGAVAVGAWTVSSRLPLPVTSRRLNHVAGATLLGVAAFVAIGLHLPSYLDAVSGLPVNVGYLGSPTAFWLVKFMDLGLVTPVAIAVGIGLLRDRAWARRPMFAIVGGYALLGVSVAAMAAVMLLADDPDASLGTLAGSVLAAALLLALAGTLYRGVLVRPGRGGRTRDEADSR